MVSIAEHHVRSPSTQWPLSPAATIAAAFVVGACVRAACLGYTTSDTFQFLLPWYDYARDHGVASLGVAFTNYTPVFTYLLLAATSLDGLVPPLALIKAISFTFEFGCAVTAYRLVATLSPDPWRAALAFCVVWLLPGVLHNGALWGQADAIWTFSLLLTLLGLLRDRPVWAMLAFAAAFAVKAQAVFLGPVLFGLALRGRVPWASFGLIPLVYAAAAIPVLMAGRPVADVLTIYLDQAHAFRLLSTSAANLYMFAPEAWYGIGVWVCMALAALCGLALAIAIARVERLTGETLVFAAAFSLMLMPFVLPKMHERYFYAFELLVVVVACLHPVFWRVVILSQITSALAYLPYDGRDDAYVPGAAMTNLVLLAFMAASLRRVLATGGAPTIDGALLSRAVTAVWAAFLAHLMVVKLLGAWIDVSGTFPVRPTDVAGFLVYLALAAFLGAVLLRTPSTTRAPSAS